MQAHGSLSVSTTIVQQKAKKSRPMKYYNDFGKAWLGDVGQRNKYLVWTPLCVLGVQSSPRIFSPQEGLWRLSFVIKLITKGICKKTKKNKPLYLEEESMRIIRNLHLFLIYKRTPNLAALTRKLIPLENVRFGEEQKLLNTNSRINLPKVQLKY